MSRRNAVRAALDPALIRAFADAAESPAAAATAAEKTQGKKQTEFLDTAWGRCEQLLPAVHAAWERFTGHGRHRHPKARIQPIATYAEVCARSRARYGRRRTIVR